MAELIDDARRRGILVVDDEIGPRESLRFLLKTRDYVNVHFAVDGKDALDKVRKLGSALYLILLDMRMPRMDGLTFLGHLGTTRLDPLGVIVTTGFPSPETESAFHQAGTENVLPLGFLPKPYDHGDLLSKVEDSLEEVHARRQRAAS